MSLDEERHDRLAKLEEVLKAIQPYLPAIICYASTMDEHEGNRIAKMLEDVL
jgi:hypothetical protein